jgi:hypothetical protein
VTIQQNVDRIQTTRENVMAGADRGLVAIRSIEHRTTTAYR